MLRIAEQVRTAIADGAAVVGLESTIIAHGLPHPDNEAIAVALEDAVRAAGAVPATIAILGGVPTVGLDRDAIAHVAREGPRFGKAGAQDMAAFIAAGRDAATTVSGTLAVAARAGVRVVATGGIGGVHRGDAGDVSHDIGALASFPGALVSSGAKAILDLPRTLEALETAGVLTVGYRTDEFPAFYTRASGLALDHRVDTPEQVAALVRVRRALGQGGVLVANPIPADAALPADDIDRAIDAALARAAAAGVTGKRLTPALLADLARATDGRAVAANRALAVDNARLSGAIAVACASAGSR